MENRPFDQFYGFAQPELVNKIDGLTGNECFPRRAFESSPDHPLDGKTQIMYNIYDKEDKYVAFALNDVTPPGEHDHLHWLRATATVIADAMPTRFEAVAGEPDVYRLFNAKPGAAGYVCEKQQEGGSYQFMHTSCNASAALPLKVTKCADCTDTGSYLLQSASGPTKDKYVSFCTSGCSGGRWLAASYGGKSDAMNVKLSDPGHAPPPPPPVPPACVQKGAEPYICKFGGPWLGHPPLGWNSSWDGFNPMCAQPASKW